MNKLSVLGGIFVNFASSMIGLVREYKKKKAFAAALSARCRRDTQPPQFINFDGMRAVGFLCELEKGADMQAVADIVASFRKAGKPFRGMVLERGNAFRDEASREEFVHLCNNHKVVFADYRMFNAAGIPVEPQFSEREDIKAFFDVHYDLFVNLNISGSFTQDLLALGADTRCLAGMANNPKMPYSIVVEPAKEDFSFSGYIDALFNYFKVINASQAQ